MTGWNERRRWFRLALRLGLPLQLLQYYTTSSELSEWEKFIEEDINAPQKLDHYLASILCEIRRSYVRDPNSVTPERFLLKFRREGAAVLVPEQPAERVSEQVFNEPILEHEKSIIERSKSLWRSIVGKPKS